MRPPNPTELVSVLVCCKDRIIIKVCISNSVRNLETKQRDKLHNRKKDAYCKIRIKKSKGMSI
jgi:hypothetical protein